MNGKYDDIIHLPHHISKTHPQMSRENRAAQFSPFAALTGYEAALQEAARQTGERIELSESAIAILDEKLRLLSETIAEHPEITVTYFQPDKRKRGGAYHSITGNLKKIDDVEGVIVLTDKRRISIVDILEIEF